MASIDPLSFVLGLGVILAVAVVVFVLLLKWFWSLF